MTRRWSFLLGILVLSGVGSTNLLLGGSQGQKLFGAFSYFALKDNLVFLLAVFVGLFVAGSLAADRRRAYPSLVLIRGITRMRYLFVKAAAMMTASSLGVFLSCVLVFVVAAMFLPWEATQPPVYVDRGSMGPYPGLLANYPLLNDLVLAGLLSLGAGSLSLGGLVFGASVNNEFLAAAVPFALVIGGIFVFRGDLTFLAPYSQLELVVSYPYSLPSWSWSFFAPLYWIVFGSVCFTATAIILSVREDL